MKMLHYKNGQLHYTCFLFFCCCFSFLFCLLCFVCLLFFLKKMAGGFYCYTKFNNLEDVYLPVSGALLSFSLFLFRLLITIILCRICGKRMTLFRNCFIIRGSNLFGWRRGYFGWRPTRWRKKTSNFHTGKCILCYCRCFIEICALIP